MKRCTLELAIAIDGIVREMEAAEKMQRDVDAIKDRCNIRLGRLMRKHRQSKGISLRRLAGILGISAPYLSDMERGNRRYSLSGVRRVLDILEKPTREESE